MLFFRFMFVCVCYRMVTKRPSLLWLVRCHRPEQTYCVFCIFMRPCWGRWLYLTVKCCQSFSTSSRFTIKKRYRSLLFKMKIMLMRLLIIDCSKMTCNKAIEGWGTIQAKIWSVSLAALVLAVILKRVCALPDLVWKLTYKDGNKKVIYNKHHIPFSSLVKLSLLLYG